MFNLVAQFSEKPCTIGFISHNVPYHCKRRWLIQQRFTIETLHTPTFLSILELFNCNYFSSRNSSDSVVFCFALNIVICLYLGFYLSFSKGYHTHACLSEHCMDVLHSQKNSTATLHITEYELCVYVFQC